MTGFRPRSPSTPLFRRRSGSHAAPDSNGASPANADIHFPQVYEDAWGRTTDMTGSFSSDRSDIERARIFLLRFTNMNPDQMVNGVASKVACFPPNILVCIAAAICGRVPS